MALYKLSKKLKLDTSYNPRHWEKQCLKIYDKHLLTMDHMDQITKPWLLSLHPLAHPQDIK